jgi:hypothetical protein
MEGIRLPVNAASANNAVQVNILKKAMDNQQASMAEILKGLPPVAPGPSHLGNNIDVRV